MLDLPRGPKTKITAIKAMQTKHMATLIRIETDAGVVGYGPCGTSGPIARAEIEKLHHARLPHLGLIGKDPLAIQVHHHNMFYAYPQRGRQIQTFSGIDIALWDLAGKLLGLPVHVLLGGPFRTEIPLYSHCGGGDFLDRGWWQETAAELKGHHNGFKAYKVDIHHPLKGHMQQHVPMISMQDFRNIAKGYALGREALSDEIDIIVHCHNELDVTSAIKVAEAIEPIKPLFFEDAIAPRFSEGWMKLRQSTRVPLLTGENLALIEEAEPFIQHQAVSCLQPDLMHAGGITGTKQIADLAAAHRMPICLHNVSGYVLDMASQQFSAAQFNCPMMECRREADRPPEAANNPPVIRDGKVIVSTAPGLGVDLDDDYLKANRLPGEPWWDEK